MEDTWEGEYRELCSSGAGEIKRNINSWSICQEVVVSVKFQCRRPQAAARLQKQPVQLKDRCLTESIPVAYLQGPRSAMLHWQCTVVLRDVERAFRCFLLVLYFCSKKSGAGNVCFCVAACVHTFFPSMMDHIFKLRCHVQAKGSGELVEGCFFVSSVTAMPCVLRGWRLWVQTTRNWHPSVAHIYGKHIGSGFSFQSIYFHSCINFIHY